MRKDSCDRMSDYNGYMWENRVCGYNDSILWAFCQLNCSEPSPNCPNNYIDGFYYNLPNCYFRPNTTGSTVYPADEQTCQSPWVAIDKLYYYLITTPFANVSSAVDGCKRSDPRATLPDFRDLAQWKAVLNYLVQIPMDSRPSTRHRIYPLGVTQVSSGKWQDTKGNWVFSDWLPYYPDTSDPNKKCVMIVDYNGYMWENRVCGYNDSILWAFCQLNCSEPNPNCPNNYIDGFYYNLPNCYFRPNTTGSSVFVTDAIRACRDFDPRSHLPFYPNATNNSILANL
uniref:C-type lectin domain-containing protein n=1 Tax=Romanomermis culicivorax TaxID=13658 RepID=A0A915KZ02_ROMCU